jgi:hypothetical protein
MFESHKHRQDFAQHKSVRLIDEPLIIAFGLTASDLAGAAFCLLTPTLFSDSALCLPAGLLLATAFVCISRRLRAHFAPRTVLHLGFDLGLGHAPHMRRLPLLGSRRLWRG